jgi:DNA invertase Pin-like site-specific DNA recombinase
MKYGYCRVSTRGQLEGNSIQEQTKQIIDRYADAEIIIESYSGAKERPIFNDLCNELKHTAYI